MDRAFQFTIAFVLFGIAVAQLQANSLAWSYVYPPLTFSPTARSFPVMSRNTTHLFVLGGEGGPTASTPTALVYNISECLPLIDG